MPTEVDRENAISESWGRGFLFLIILQTLVLVTYDCATFAFAPLLDADFTVFTTYRTYLWLLPVLGCPVALLLLYLVYQHRNSVNITVMQVIAWIYGLMVLGIIIWASVDWFQHCRSGATTKFSYCIDAFDKLTWQFMFIFWTLVAHEVIFIITCALAWYTMRTGMLGDAYQSMSTETQMKTTVSTGKMW